MSTNSLPAKTRITYKKAQEIAAAYGYGIVENLIGYTLVRGYKRIAYSEKLIDLYNIMRDSIEEPSYEYLQRQLSAARTTGEIPPEFKLNQSYAMLLDTWQSLERRFK